MWGVGVLLCFPGHYKGNHRNIIWGQMLNKELIYPFCYWCSEGWMRCVTNTIWIAQNRWGAQWACTGSLTEVATPFYYTATFCLESVQWEATGHSYARKGICEVIFFHPALGNTLEINWCCFPVVRPPALFQSHHRRQILLATVTFTVKQSRDPLMTYPDLSPPPSEFLGFYRSAEIPFSLLLLGVQTTSRDLPSRPINILGNSTTPNSQNLL